MDIYQTVLFDLDGTITDPGQGITNSVAYALEKMGVSPPERKELYRFIGPPLMESFAKYYGFPPAAAQAAVGFYREYFQEKGIYENVLIEGMPALLARLQTAGKALLLATSKPQVYAEEILRYFGIEHYFSFVAGSNLDGTRTAKQEVIAYALHSAQVAATQTAIMVGDRLHDILGARKMGIASVGVLFGYGSREELAQAGATYIAATPKELEKVLLPR